MTGPGRGRLRPLSAVRARECGLADRVIADDGSVGYVDTDGDGRWDVRFADDDGDGAADSATQL